jgi:hypothetical protein
MSRSAKIWEFVSVAEIAAVLIALAMPVSQIERA